MKNIIFTLALTLIASFTFASDPNESSRPKVLNLDEVIQSIQYPQISRETGVEGRVVVKLRVDEKGHVSDYKVVKTPCSNLQESVEQSIAELKFEPAKNSKGNAVISIVTLPIDFSLDLN